MFSNELTSTTAPASRGKGRREATHANHGRFVKLGVILALAITMTAMFLPENLIHFRASAATAKGFSYSTPITLNAAGTQLWVVNPDADNNSVSVVDVGGDGGNL